MVKRLSMDCKATVEIGEYSRGGETRGYNKAQDHDMGTKEKYVPCGIVDEDTGQLYVTFGSSYKTSDFMVDNLEEWWKSLSRSEKQRLDIIQIKVDNGPENSGRRRQFLKRMVEFADQTQKSIQLLYYPPYHSKYNPIERTWAVLENHWNGSILDDIETALKFAETMTWKGKHPIVKLVTETYEKGVKLTQKAM